MAEKTKVYATMRDAVVDILFTKVLQTATPKEISEHKTLKDFVPKAYSKFADDMVVVYLDKIEREFSVPSSSMKNKSIGEILAKLEHAKNMASKYGARPIKRSQFKKY